MNKSDKRSRTIVRTSIIGIIANLFLAGFKAAVGVFSHSIAVVLDAVNNLSDALSSVITIIGTRLANRKPDKDHPLGHGRIEYLAAMIIAVIVLYAGVTSLWESIKKIIHPETADYSPASLIIIASAVVVKIVLGRYVKATGERVNSGALVASGADALFDAVLSASVLASAIIYLVSGLSLEAFVGVVISGFIIKSGIEMLQDTLGDILGKRVDREFVDKIKETIGKDENVRGVYDLILHNYGPDRFVGSVHVEIPNTMSAEEIDLMERRITQKVYEEHGVIMAGVGIYSANVDDHDIIEMRTRINQIVMSHEGVLQMHGFFADREKKIATMDIILDFALEDRQAVFEHICDDIRREFPDYTFEFALDIDF